MIRPEAFWPCATLRAIHTAAHPDPADDRVDLDAVRREAAAEAGCRHAELPDTMWPRLRAAEEAAERRLTLLRTVIAYDDANQSDLPLPLLDGIRAETGGPR
jgi:hypothetical protein